MQEIEKEKNVEDKFSTDVNKLSLDEIKFLSKPSEELMALNETRIVESNQVLESILTPECKVITKVSLN